MIAVLLLLASAGPPVRHLPPGALARLGYARLTVERGAFRVSPDGRWVVVEPRAYGETPPDPPTWLRLADGAAVTPPVRVPAGYTLRRLFPDGRYLVAREGRHLVLPAGVAVDGKDLSFDRAGRVCLKAEDEGLAVGDVSRGPVRWHSVVSTGEAIRPLLADGGRHVVWVEADGGVRVHDLATGKRAVVPVGFREDEGVWQMAVSPDGRTLAVWTRPRVRLFDVRAGKPARALDGDHDPNGQGDFSPDGAAFILAGEGGLLVVPTDPAAGPRKVALALTGRPREFALFPDGRRVASCDAAGVVRVHDLRTGKQLDAHSRFPAFAGVRVTGPDAAVSWTEGGALVTWDLRTGCAVSEATVPGGPFASMEFGPGGRHVVARTAAGRCTLAEAGSGKVVARADVEPSSPTAAFHPSGKTVTLGGAREGRRWRLDHLDVAGGRVVPGVWTEARVGEGGHRFSPDGRLLLWAAGTGVQMLEAGSLRPRWSRRLPSVEGRREREETTWVAFDAKGRRAVVVRETDAAVFDAFSGRTSAFLLDGGCEPRGCALSASGRWLVTCSGWGVRLWDLDARHPADPVLEWTPPAYVNGLDLDADGGRLVTAHPDGACFVWDVKALRERPAAKADAWEGLGATDPEAALPAMRALIAEPGPAVRLLAGRLAPIPAVAKEKVAAWVAELSAEAFARREAAQKQLAAHLEAAEGQLRAAAETAPLEARLRLRRLLRALDDRPDDPSWLRRARAVEVLERIGTKEAAAVLRRVASGAEGAALTREAAAALGRVR